MRSPSLPLFTLPLLILSACAAGPEYERPPVAGESANWSDPQPAGDVDLEPWRTMGDPLLIALIEQAAGANLDLAEAEARLREARAGRDAAAGRRLPELAANASASHRRQSENGEFPFGQLPFDLDREYSLYDAGFDASWEIDLWGARRRAVEAEAWRVRAGEANVREVRLRVVAEVARAYAELRAAQAQAQILRAEAQGQDRLATLTGQLFRSGEIGEAAHAEAEAAMHRAKAAVPEAEAEIVTAMNTIAVLVGEPPEALQERLAAPADPPSLPEQVGAGLRSDILRRRPDVMIAEARLAAATAEGAVARAQMFPRLTLIGGIGLQSRRFGEIDDGDSLRFGVGPALHWPIFSGGRIRANIRAADARADAAAAVYEKAVLTALADSETALNRYNAALAAARELEAAKDRQARSLALAEDRFGAGEDSRIDLEQARSRYNAAALAAADARSRALRAHAMLVKALGGGWAAPE